MTNKKPVEEPLFYQRTRVVEVVNIHHPLIAPLFADFKRSKGIAFGVPLSDAERREFEEHARKIIIERGYNNDSF